MDSPRTFGFRPFAKALFSLAFVVASAISLLSIKVALDGSIVTGMVASALCSAYAVKAYKAARHVWTYRIHLGNAGLRLQTVDHDSTIPFSEMTGFLEMPMRFDSSAFGGYQFAVFRGRHEYIHFSTQIVGWAALIEGLHQVRPDLVPPARNLSARGKLGIGKEPMTVGAAMLTAAGQDMPEEWNHPSRTRWYDVIIGCSLGLWAASSVSNFISKQLESAEWPILTWFVPLIFVTLAVGYLVLQGYVSTVTKWRRGRDARHA